MIPDIDIYRVANLLVKRHGQDASIEAAMRADAMLEKGDLDGCDLWKRILRAVALAGVSLFHLRIAQQESAGAFACDAVDGSRHRRRDVAQCGCCCGAA